MIERVMREGTCGDALRIEQRTSADGVGSEEKSLNDLGGSRRLVVHVSHRLHDEVRGRAAQPGELALRKARERGGCPAWGDGGQGCRRSSLSLVSERGATRPSERGKLTFSTTGCALDSLTGWG